MLLTGRLLIDWVTKRGKRLKKGNKGGLTHVEVEPILWLRTKQILAGIKGADSLRACWDFLP